MCIKAHSSFNSFILIYSSAKDKIEHVSCLNIWFKALYYSSVSWTYRNTWITCTLWSVQTFGKLTRLLQSPYWVYYDLCDSQKLRGVTEYSLILLFSIFNQWFSKQTDHYLAIYSEINCHLFSKMLVYVIWFLDRAKGMNGQINLMSIH